MNYIKCSVAALLCMLPSLELPLSGQEKPREWEFGLSGAAVNLTRMSVTDFHQTQGGDYVFNVREKNLHGGLELYAAKKLKDWLYADVQGTLGLVSGCGDGKSGGRSVLAGPGLQIRPFVRSQWLTPYLRVGLDWYDKTFPTSYFGQFDNDPTKEGIWKAEDAWNKGLTMDRDNSVPLSLGCGVTGWLSSKVGVRLQFQYLHPLSGLGINFAQSSAGMVLRLGGEDRRKAAADRYVMAHLSEYDHLYSERFPSEVVEKEVVREVPVEKVVEVVRETVSTRTLAELLDNVCFEFDSAEITPDSEAVLDEMAGILLNCKEMRFLVGGFTDAKGSDDYNDVLSADRAVAVKKALVNRGVDSSSLCARGFGKRMAVIPETESDEDRRGDRKVVIERITDDRLWKQLKQIEKQ